MSLDFERSVAFNGASGAGFGAMAEPVFILSPPLSCASFVSAMLGRHPRLYDLPETHLFLAETLRAWWEVCAQASFDMADGLLRAVAEIELGGQTETHVELAGGWLRRRLPFTTGHVLETLAEKTYPKAIVERSPSLVFHLEAMQRAYRMFPHARFIHIVQSPWSYAEAVITAVQEATAAGCLPPWLRDLAFFPSVGADDCSQELARVEPQHAWHALHLNICAFLESVPEPQKLRVRSEEILGSRLSPGLRKILGWLGLHADAEALEAMRHPEWSPYAYFGPPGARYGNDPAFLRNPIPPTLLSKRLKSRCSGDQRITPEVAKLAKLFGYRVRCPR